MIARSELNHGIVFPTIQAITHKLTTMLIQLTHARAEFSSLT